ncbi:hypothetical protein NP493_4571g00000 [Ridgeia piscesae]|uniref:Fibronectin type-III domain-containing protein n=1 Tax=Ridgeia piscesae TaxID=27915 RepID=A0AAD9IYG7_RIDPI|nr:hypothetical protein NP493_4571g00000 [Ridgeia piscesae]
MRSPLTWDKPRVTNGNLKKYVITYKGNPKQFKDRVKGTIEMTESELSYTVEKLKAGYTYEFEIRAYTGNSQAGDPASLKVTLPVQAPYIALPDIAKATPTLVNDSVTTSSFEMEFVNPFSDKKARSSATPSS